MSEIKNDAGETITTVASDAEAVRWFHEQGRLGDYLAETDELLADMARQIMPEVRFSYDHHGCVVIRKQHPEEGCDRCACGSKYWDGDICHSCGERWAGVSA